MANCFPLDAERVTALFSLAGIPIERMWELTNLYWRDNGPRGPWFLVKAAGGNLIRIGWRKRVIEIDYESTLFRGLLTSDDVTKTDTLVHAWSQEKALEYLSSLSSQLFPTQCS